MKELWMEYENNSSAEAKLVKDFDKVHLIPSKSCGGFP
jgi:5'-deoxynucleotidase YfbR-like HD superfamily hydrolase